MSVRYVTRPATGDEVWEWARATDYLARTVHEPEPAMVKTGILDSSGTPLYRVDDRQPVGFINHGARA